ncbi:hypothetical protein [Desulfitobacterium sp.]|uniref:hypothetical protein n=1 Tax=Desulfitobacterium sp. TaxID=49981 RepID=UPI002C773195|nr:hypothetical protein [Desulfitobacterium sp.]HVJ49510.1 hypothetical protein [Desulfitobacterium sp.]
MSMMKQRIARISLVGILIFGLLLGGQFIYKNNWVNGHLAKDSQQISGVLSAQVVSENGQQILEVTTDHLQNLAEVEQQLEKLAGQRPIRLKDQRTPELEKLLAKMEFPLQEGIARGDFVQMEQTLQQQAAQTGVTIDLSMNNEKIFLNLTQGQAQLLEVVERSTQGKFLASVSQ